LDLILVGEPVIVRFVEELFDVTDPSLGLLT
jgi:hypothetical protein